MTLGVPNVASPKGLLTKFTPHRFHIWVYRRILGFEAVSTVIPGAIGMLPGSMRARLVLSQQARADDMMAWRDKEIISRYNAGGVTKFAFITGERVPFPTVESGADPAPDGPATFPTGWFASRDRAYQWLAE